MLPTHGYSGLCCLSYITTSTSSTVLHSSHRHWVFYPPHVGVPDIITGGGDFEEEHINFIVWYIALFLSRLFLICVNLQIKCYHGHVSIENFSEYRGFSTVYNGGLGIYHPQRRRDYFSYVNGGQDSTGKNSLQTLRVFE